MGWCITYTYRCETDTMSAFLANCICALGARFATGSLPAASSWAHQTQPFIEQAQNLIIPLLHLPAYDTITGLHLLAWASYGLDSESGLWQFASMAYRMATDLGIHENSEIFETPAHVVRTRLLFWGLLVTDRIIAIGTGRRTTIPEHVIQIPLPEDEDMYPDPAKDTVENDLDALIVQPAPFVYFVRLMIICGRISDALNRRSVTLTVADNAIVTPHSRLHEHQMALLQFVANLPLTLQWSSEALAYHIQRGHGVGDLNRSVLTRREYFYRFTLGQMRS